MKVKEREVIAENLHDGIINKQTTQSSGLNNSHYYNDTVEEDGGQWVMESESSRRCSRPAGNHPVRALSFPGRERRLCRFTLRGGGVPRCLWCTRMWRSLVHARE